MANIQELKAALIEALGNQDINFDQVHAISQQLVALDEKSVRFSIDARHIHRLGFELVGKQETALSELIKNAYDADATKIEIEFKNFMRPGGSLVIEDDGHGMTDAVIRNTWMRLSTQDKEVSPISPTYGRSRAGRKGIGRFAVERLGQELRLETMVSGCETGTRVHFHWDADFTHGKDLNQISYNIEKFEKPVEDTGTRLIIEKLRDKWTPDIFDRVWKSVLLLQPPFKAPTRSRATDTSLDGFSPDPGFRVHINGKIGDKVAQEFSIEKTFLSHGIAKISGDIDATGKGTFYVNSRKLKLDDHQEIDNKFLLCGPLSFEATYFIYDHKVMSGASVGNAREMGRKFGGIRIYRDGFRVLPYGETHDDWLELAADTGRRILLIPANNHNFFGHVEITSSGNPLLEETSSREGLIENEAYEELQRFLRGALEWGTKRVASERNRKTDAGQKGFVSEWRKPSEKTEELIAEIKASESKTIAVVGGTEKDKTIRKLEEIKQDQTIFEDQVERREAEHVQYETMLRILASLGVSLAVFSHEVRGALTGVDSSIEQLFKKLEKKSERADIQELLSQRDELDLSVDRLRDVSHYIADLISHSSSRERSNQALHGVIESFVSQFKNYFNAHGIDFETKIDPPYLRTDEMHRSELDSVLFNFLTNAVKSMDRSKSRDRKVKITAVRNGELAVISFQDTGGGVSTEIKHRIFDAFFTTSLFKGDEIAGPGSGLGLKIVSDIAEANGGYVRLGEPDPGYFCRFDFAVPLSREQI